MTEERRIDLDPVPLASGEGSPVDITLDATHVYFTDWSGGRILCTPREGGAVTVLTSGHAFAFASPIVADAQDLFVAVEDPSVEMFGGALLRVPKAGGGATTLLGGVQHIAGLAMDDGVLYASFPFEGLVRRVSKTGEASVVAEDQGFPVGVAVDATHLYWTNKSAGTVLRMPKSGGAPETIASGESAPYAIVVDAEDAFWSDAGKQGSIVRSPLGGGARTVLARDVDGATHLAADATHVYWSCAAGVFRMRRPAGPLEPLASGIAPEHRTLPQLSPSAPKGIAVDADGLFIADLGAGAVLRLSFA